MPANDPAPELAGLGRDHHEGLLLGWKIRTGMAKDVPPVRIQRYCRWFLREHLVPHFAIEEDLLFPVLGPADPLVRKALAAHRRIQRLILGRSRPEVALTHIEEELEALIRLEDRRLLPRISEVATPALLAEVQRVHEALPEPQGGRPEDRFWAKD